MSKRRSLGLEATRDVFSVLTGTGDSEKGQEIIPIGDIIPNPNQPRKKIGNIEELAHSIEEKGIIQPLIVRRKDSKYEIVAGERRYLAAKKADIQEIPCVVKDYDDEEVFEIALIENLQREDLNPIEETEGILNLLDAKLKKSDGYKKYKGPASVLRSMYDFDRGHSHTAVIVRDIVENIFQAIGVNWLSFLNNKVPLLNLPEDVKGALINYLDFKPTHALEVGKIEDIHIRKQLIEKVLKDGIGIRELRVLVRSYQKGMDKERKPKGKGKKEYIKFNEIPNLTLKPGKKKVDISIDITKGNLLETLRNLVDLVEGGKVQNLLTP